MNRVVTIATKDISQVLRDKKAALFLLLMPVAFTAAFGFAFESAEQDVTPKITLLIDEGDRERAKPIVDLLENPGGFEVLIAPLSTREQAIDDVKNQDVHVLAELATKRLDSLIAGQKVPLDVIADEGRVEATLALRALETSLFRARVVYEAGAQAASMSLGSETARADAITAAVGAWRKRSPVDRVAVSEAGVYPPPSGFRQASPGILLQFAIMGILSMATLLVEERRKGTLERMLAGTVRRSEVILGHGLAIFFVSLLQMVTLVLIGQFVFGVDYGQSPLGIAAVLLSLAVFLAGLGLVIGAFSRKEEQAVLFSLGAMFLFSGLGGAWMPLEVTGELFQTIGHLLPSAWAMDALQDIVVREKGASAVLLPCLVILGWAVALGAVAVWRLRQRAATRA